MNGEKQVLYTKLELIADIFKIYLKKNPYRKDSWYGETFDTLYDKSLVDLAVCKDILLKR